MVVFGGMVDESKNLYNQDKVLGGSNPAKPCISSEQAPNNRSYA